MTEPDISLAETGLSPAAVALYGHITRQDRCAFDLGDRPELAELVEWGLVGFDPDRPHIPVALDPAEAIRRRLACQLDQARRRVAEMAALPALSDQLAVHYDRAQWRAGGGSEFIDDAAVVNARLDDVVASAQSEILSAQPGGPRDARLLERCVARDQAALNRGVVLRTLYRDTVRDHPVTAEYARIMSRNGGAYRTLVSHFERCIIVDRRVAFISDHVVEGAPEHAAWQITDRAMVAWIAAVYENEWNRADPWHGDLRSRRDGQWAFVDTITGADGVRTTPRQREILRAVAAGIEQRVLARRLGVSPRTLSDQITVLKGVWGVQTLPELTYQWALSPDRLIDDGAPPADADRAQGGDDGAGLVETAA